MSERIVKIVVACLALSVASTLIAPTAGGAPPPPTNRAS